ncbi:MAG: hypothetical protein JSR59_10990 [Proteobacteria bacterium]|nr:hypothetical protein [Pseudomonadota bacterium]
MSPNESRLAAEALHRRAMEQMALDEYAALPLLEAAYAAADRAGLPTLSGLCARAAVVALNYGEATSAGLHAWTDRVARTAAGMPSGPDDASRRAWWLAGDLACVYASGAADYRSASTLRTLDDLKPLVLNSASGIDDDARAIGALVLFEYAEFEDDEPLFDRLVSALSPWLLDERGRPLYRGRVWHRIHRCAFTIGPTRQRDTQRIDPAAAEGKALEIAERHGLVRLEAAVLAVRGFYANVRQDDAVARASCERLGQIADFQRPMEAAWYYFLRGQACARAESLTQASLFYAQAVDAGRRAEAAPAAQQTFLIGHAGMLAALGRWDEADAIYAELLATQSGRDRDITACRRDLAYLQRMTATGDAATISPARQALLARAEALRWSAFYLASPRTTADFLVAALRDRETTGTVEAFIAGTVRSRRLPARHDYPRRWPWTVRIEAMGGLRVFVDGAEVRFGARPQKRPIELLKLLVAHGPQPVGVDVAIDALWPEAAGDNAKGSFDMTLLRLRKLLGHDEVVSLDAGRVGLDREHVWVDAWEFLEDERAPYGGALFGDDAAQPWFAPARRRIHDRHLQRVRRRAEQFEAEQRPADALALYVSALDQDPLAESMTRGAMRCCIALGEPARAIELYEQCRDRLSSALGVSPSEATRKIADSLR